MKRIFLFILTNLAVVLVLGTAASLLGVNRYLTGTGINLGALLGFCLVFGFGGAFISLLLSRPMAKWSTGAQVIDGSEGRSEAWLVNTVRKLAEAAGISMPEVAIYDGAPNAFATGASKNRSLVAVSTGLLQTMNENQVEAVLAHEMAHVANGDAVTLTLIQGVLNTFVMFLARVVGYFVDRVLLKNDKEGVGIGYTVSVVVLDLLFGLVAAMIVAAFSRHREYRADAGAAALMGQPHSMISALNALAGRQEGELPKNLAAFGITGKGVMSLFASHPSIDARIKALQVTG
ncbi:heat-shock protein HtpX [Burkholderia ubonensis]|uniref:Protease HtpX homolog n=1 Tax=Burkholderia ubonensis TaxID=101571 RepID=A0AAW3N2P0_9BURK|nr:protease HtpX [Burkholderia ubonensis]KVP75448.1 heat-shock protein HtpX [Burkholderia ubonensis]KVP98261.1 heat-shock protein HtpX [Burkholderia ubonensis]KVZ92959.1 heat-shock protein HtpX [Burkholderia ubonensis]